ncbi:hypothetical protein F5B21DRAFT_95762 [Xylaria acuta]|nr:hypothetical protein F5B21DRAFT_95762 [Xylaria acuta]
MLARIRQQLHFVWLGSPLLVVVRDMCLVALMNNGKMLHLLPPKLYYIHFIDRRIPIDVVLVMAHNLVVLTSAHWSCEYWAGTSWIAEQSK